MKSIKCIMCRYWLNFACVNECENAVAADGRPWTAAAFEAFLSGLPTPEVAACEDFEDFRTAPPERPMRPHL